MKLRFITFAICLLILSVFYTPRTIFASNAPVISISDAIYADLAVRHYLDNVSLFYSNGKAVNDLKLNETKHWLPASTVKTFAAMYAYDQIASNKLKLKDTIIINEKNSVPTELVTDELPTLQAGQSVTIERLIRQMITQSDNTAFNQLLDILGRDAITGYIQSLGLTHSHIGSKLNLDTSQTEFEYDVPGYGVNTTTAEDYALAFQLIKSGKIPDAKDLFAVLKDQKINNMIPYYLPKEVTCAHKTGDLAPLYHDGGICQDKKNSYILTIFTNANDPLLLAHLSELIYTKNYDLVGKTLQEKPLAFQKTPPIDELVLSQSQSSVLGVSTVNSFPLPNITAADLGVTANDLSGVIKDNDLPHVFIPADSSFHFLSDTWQVFKRVVAPNPQARRAVDLETARLRVAEAKDLLSQGKTTEALAITQTLQSGLAAVASDKNLAEDGVAQNNIQSVSETRFEVLGQAVQQAKGDEKLVLIKQIADQARATVANVQPHTPDANNASNPSQKPLIGTIVNTSKDSITVKTAGGQEIKVPTSDGTVSITEKPTPLIASATPTETISVSSTPSITSDVSGVPETNSVKSLQVGSTVALVGTSVNNIFIPKLILSNIPTELAAPQPVTVTKVDLKHDTMVVEENGVYTQVDINNKTSIKAADTNIPLKEIKAGDIVVVHGEPLTQTNTNPTPTISITPFVSPSVTKSSTSFSVFNSENAQSTGTPPTGQTASVTPTVVFSSPSLVRPTSSLSLSSPTASTGKGTTLNVPTHTLVPTVTTPQTKPTTNTGKINTTSTPVNTVSKKPSPPTTVSATVQTPVHAVPALSAQPRVIKGTSIQVIEKKQDVSQAAGQTSKPQPVQSQPVQQQTPKAVTNSKPQTPPQQNVPPQPAAPAASQNTQPAVTTSQSDNKKK